MKQIFINLFRLLQTLIKYTKSMIAYRIAFIISALKYDKSFDLSNDEDDINVVYH